MIRELEGYLERPIHYKVIKEWGFNIGGLHGNQSMKELKELLPRYHHDNHFNSDKFKIRFLEFQVTTYIEGLKELFPR